MPKGIDAKIFGSWLETSKEALEYTANEFDRRGYDKDYTFKSYRKRIRRNKPYIRSFKRHWYRANYNYHNRYRPYYYS